MVVSSAEPRQLEDYLVDCEEPLDQFRKLHGDAFLIFHGKLSALDAPDRPQKTLGSEVIALSEAPLMRPEFAVFPVRHTGRSALGSFITVGRTRNNDIVIEDVSLSKFHALFTCVDGVYYLQDAGSRNGTFIGECAVPSRTDGGRATVESGSRIRFGSVTTTFLGAVEFRELVVDLA